MIKSTSKEINNGTVASNTYECYYEYYPYQNPFYSIRDYNIAFIMAYHPQSDLSDWNISAHYLKKSRKMELPANTLYEEQTTPLPSYNQDNCVTRVSVLDDFDSYIFQ